MQQLFKFTPTHPRAVLLKQQFKIEIKNATGISSIIIIKRFTAEKKCKITNKSIRFIYRRRLKAVKYIYKLVRAYCIFQHNNNNIISFIIPIHWRICHINQSLMSIHL